MKHFLSFLIFLVFQSAISQNLSVSELVNIYENKNVEELNYFLSQKGWKFEKAQKDSPREKFDEILWHYYQNKNGINGFFSIVTNDDIIRLIEYSILDINFNHFRQSLTNSNFNIVSNNIENDAIKSVYTNGKYRINISTRKIMYYNESRTMYFIGFSLKEYYKSN